MYPRFHLGSCLVIRSFTTSTWFNSSWFLPNVRQPNWGLFVVALLLFYVQAWAVEAETKARQKSTNEAAIPVTPQALTLTNLQNKATQEEPGRNKAEFTPLEKEGVKLTEVMIGFCLVTFLFYPLIQKNGEMDYYRSLILIILLCITVALTAAVMTGLCMLSIQEGVSKGEVGFRLGIEATSGFAILVMLLRKLLHGRRDPHAPLQLTGLSKADRCEVIDIVEENLAVVGKTFREQIVDEARQKNLEAFLVDFAVLVEKHYGQHVLYKDGKMIDFGDHPRDIESRFKGKPDEFALCLLEKVEGESTITGHFGGPISGRLL